MHHIASTLKYNGHIKTTILTHASNNAICVHYHPKRAPLVLLRFRYINPPFFLGQTNRHVTGDVGPNPASLRWAMAFVNWVVAGC